MDFSVYDIPSNGWQWPLATNEERAANNMEYDHLHYLTSNINGTTTISGLRGYFSDQPIIAGDIKCIIIINRFPRDFNHEEFIDHHD